MAPRRGTIGTAARLHERDSTPTTPTTQPPPPPNTDAAVTKAGKMADQAQLPPEYKTQLIADVKNNGATSDSQIEELVANLAQKATLATRLPPEVVSMTHGKPTEDQLKQAMNIYNAAQHSGAPAKDTNDILVLLTNRDPQALASLSQVIGGPATSGVSYNLGPAYGNKSVFVNGQQQKAYDNYFPTASQNLHTVMQAASFAGLPPQLLAAASEANRQAILGGSSAPSVKVHGWFNSIGFAPATGEYDLANTLQQYLNQYGDYTLALLATHNVSVADKIRAGVPLNDQEKADARQFLTNANYSLDSMGSIGLAIDPVKYNYVANQIDAAGSNKATVHLPNPDEVQHALETVFRGWFQHAPSADELAAFKAQVNAQAMQAQRGATGGVGNPFQTDPAGTGKGVTVTDAPSLPEAAIAYARNDPEYQQLFANKPGNLDETSYAQQFSNTAQKLFGEQGAGEADAIRAGMQSGDVNQTAGYLAAEGSANDNATFQERLAQAATAVKSMI